MGQQKKQHKYDLNEHSAASLLELALQYAPSVDDHTGNALDAPPVADAGYKILDKIGEGGMGTVWRAQQLGTGQLVALKALKRELLQRPGALARFHTEVQLAASLKHPSIARVFDSGLDRLDYFYVMELIEGRPIDEAVLAGNYSARAIVELMVEVCEAVGYAHAHGVVHLDLKPSNILISDDGRPHILDFGLARAVGPNQRSGEPLPYRAGTQGYIAPEQIISEETIDQRADVYSLGRVLGELLRSAPARDGKARDDDLEAIVRKAVAEDPCDRYPDAVSMTHDLGNWLELRPVSAQHSSIRYAYSLWARRNRRTLYRLLFVLIPLIIVTSGVGFAVYRKEASTLAISLRSEATLYRSTLRSARERLNQGDIQQAQQLLMGADPGVRGWEWKYLSGLADQSTHTIAFEGDVIRDLTYVGNDTVICLTSSGEVRRVSIHDDGWDVTSRSVDTIAPLAIGSDADYIVGLDRQGGSELRYLDNPNRPETVLLSVSSSTYTRISPDGQYVLFASGLDDLILYDTRKHEAVRRLTRPADGIVAGFSGDGRNLVWYDGSYRVLDLETQSLSSHTIEHPTDDPPRALAAFGGTLYIGFSGGTVLNYDLNTNARTTPHPLIPSDVSNITISHGGNQIACTGRDGGIYISGVEAPSWRVLQGHTEPALKIRFSEDGRRLYSLSLKGSVKVWDTEWATYEHKAWPTGHATLSAVDSSGRYMAYASMETSATVFDSQAKYPGTKPVKPRGVEIDKLPSALAFAPDADWLGVADMGRSVRIFDNDKVLAVLEMTAEPAYWLDFDRWSQRLAASNSREVQVWSVNSDKPIRWFDRSGPCLWLKAAPSWLAMIRHGREDGYAVEVRDVENDLQVYLDPLGAEPVIAMAVAKDAARVATLDSDRRIKVHDINTSDGFSLSASVDIGAVLSLALSHNGTRLVTAGDSVIIWSVKSGEILDVIEQKTEGPIMAIQFTDDGRELVGRGLVGYYRWRAK